VFVKTKAASGFVAPKRINGALASAPIVCKMSISKWNLS